MRDTAESPVVVLLATPVFTVLYVLGKWNAWKLAWRTGGGPQVALSALVALTLSTTSLTRAQTCTSMARA